MPVVSFTVTWPNGSSEHCSSPSRAITEFLDARSYTVSEFATAAKAGLDEASNRVLAKFGFACSAAADQWYQLSRRIDQLPTDATVTVSYP
jgi:uncharacterized repeat protein (TIGR04042 family)